MKIFIKLAIIAQLICLFNFCSFDSDIYIAFYWPESYGKPDTSFNTDLPNVPPNISNIDYGVYYITLPGNYSIQYQYLGYSIYSKSFALTRSTPVLGRESVYYDIFIYRDSDPEIKKVPWSY